MTAEREVEAATEWGLDQLRRKCDRSAAITEVGWREVTPGFTVFSIERLQRVLRRIESERQRADEAEREVEQWKSEAMRQGSLLVDTVNELESEIERLRRWVDDLQSGLYINCVYCGHRYDPGTPGVQSEVLYEHIRECPEHPLSKAEARVKELEEVLDALGVEIVESHEGSGQPAVVLGTMFNSDPETVAAVRRALATEEGDDDVGGPENIHVTEGYDPSDLPQREGGNR